MIKRVIPSQSRLMFIKQTQYNKYHNGKLIQLAKAIFKCQCGKFTETNMYPVFYGRVLSCGCLRNENRAKSGHGLSKHPLFVAYNNIKARCYKKNNPAYKWYGAKEVSMCTEWLNDFKSFYKWCIANGWQKGMEVDKDIKATKMGIPAIVYSPEMCSIVNRATNMASTAHKKYWLEGKKSSLKQIAAKVGLTRGALKYRICTRKMSVEEAIIYKKNKHAP